VLDNSAKFDLRPFFDDLSRAPQSALLVDYDGTLSAFQLKRDRAFPYPGVSILLTEIMNAGHSRVVVVTGRPAHEVVPLLGIEPPPEIWGAHGLQRLRSDGPCELPHPDELATQALAQADTWLDEVGLHSLAEHKPGGLAVHWRGLPPGKQDDIREIVSRRWLPVADSGCLALQEFDGGLEISMPDPSKGDAVRTILNELSREASVAYLGDDETDEDAFNAVANRGLRVLVRSEWRETAADVWLKPPAELLMFLCEWLAACRNAQRPPLSTSYSLNRAASRGK
jgi:trehalose-phosphatase